MESCRYFKSVFPGSNDIVIVKIGRLTEFGYHVDLLEYDNMEGFINLSEFMYGKGKMKKKNPVKEGDIVPMTVMQVDQSKGHIDLSKKKMSEKNKEEALNAYRYTTYLHRMGREIYQLHKEFSDNVTLESIMSSTIWKLYDDYEDETYEKIYINVLYNPKLLFTNNIFSENFVGTATKSFTDRIVRTNMVKEATFHLLTTHRDGVGTIKKILSHCDKILIFVESPPYYTIRLEAIDDTECEKILGEYLETVKKRSEEVNAEFHVTDSIKIVKETVLDLKFLPYT